MTWGAEVGSGPAPPLLPSCKCRVTSYSFFIITRLYQCFKCFLSFMISFSDLWSFRGHPAMFNAFPVKWNRLSNLIFSFLRFIKFPRRSNCVAVHQTSQLNSFRHTRPVTPPLSVATTLSATTSPPSASPRRLRPAATLPPRRLD